MTMINGAILIGQHERVSSVLTKSVDPATGDPLEPGYSTATADDVSGACALAAAAAIPFAALPAESRAAFLEAIGEEIMATGDDLIVRAMQESALPRARIESERGRTIGQLSLFARVLREGSWADITIDPALPDRAPMPRPDLRRRNIALGPVAVFGASNFPLAFSVAGGDTASALAAGCPVVVKGHPSHPGTGELVARAIVRAAERCGMPEGVFSFLPGGVETGTALVTDPRVKAVGFTGSRAGGLALMQAAANRREPIPVYAEMSSINPVLLLPAALAARGAELGSAFIASLTMGAGQFCTNPGLVVTVDGPGLDIFLDAASAAASGSAAQTMLNPGIHAAYDKGVAALADHPGVELLARGEAETGCNQSRTALMRTSAEAFLAHEELGEELFGAASLVVVARGANEMAEVMSRIEGQLTATLLMDPADEPAAAALLPILERKVGRILVNGWPTGVEVCHAMVHGGPFPSTSDSRTTSVGSAAIARFMRPVCYQNFTPGLLPDELSDANPMSAPRRVEGMLVLPQ